MTTRMNTDGICDAADLSAGAYLETGSPADIAPMHISDYIALPSVDFEVSNVISSAKAAVSCAMDSIASQVSVFVQPFKMPDYDLSAVWLSAKQKADELKQEAAKKIDQTISAIENTTKAVMATLYGWVDTSETTSNISAAGKAIGDILNGAVSKIGNLPLPVSIPGLDQIKGVVAMLSSMEIPKMPA